MHELPVDTVDLIIAAVKRVPNDKIKICAAEGRKQIEVEALK